MIFLLLAAVLVAALLASQFPGRLEYFGAPQVVEEFVSKQLPLGTSIDGVRQWLTVNGHESWEIRHRLPVIKGYEFKGQFEIKAILAKYFLVTVVVTFSFDDSGHLVAITAHKSYDSI